MKGHTYKRCPCGTVRGPDGQRVNCAKKHGSWYYVHELPADTSATRRQVFKGGFATERDARHALQEAVRAVQDGFTESTRLTVEEYLAQWLESKGALRSNTRRSYAGHLQLYLNPTLGHLRLSELRETHISAAYAAMRQLGRESGAVTPALRRLQAARSGGVVRPLGVASVRRVHATLMSALNAAVRRRLIRVNPAAYVELPAARRPRAVVWTPGRVEAWHRTGQRPSVAVWTAEQAGAFLDAATFDRLYPLFHLIAYRGLRRGEAVGLRWADVDLQWSQITISQQVVQLGWQLETGQPKTDSGARLVTLDPVTAQVLGTWKGMQDAERGQWGNAWQDTGLVFTREDGTGLHPATVTRTFHRLADDAGLPPIRLHDLRHTAASLALQAGVPLKVVSEQLGHSSLAITADTYTSVLPAAAQAAAQAMADVVPRAFVGAVGERPSAAPLAFRWQFGLQEGVEHHDQEEKPQVRQGAPSGTRTPNPLIKSQLLCLLS